MRITVDVESPRFEQILTAVVRERTYQDRKWGTIQDHPHTIMEWLVIMEEELGEAKRAWARGGAGAEVAAMQELLQVVAVGFAAMEQHGIQER